MNWTRRLGGRAVGLGAMLATILGGVTAPTLAGAGPVQIVGPQQQATGRMQTERVQWNRDRGLGHAARFEGRGNDWGRHGGHDHGRHWGHDRHDHWGHGHHHWGHGHHHHWGPHYGSWWGPRPVWVPGHWVWTGWGWAWEGGHYTYWR
jgi:hypothetical protein